MKIKHFAGYGTVNATKIKDTNHTLHIRVEGDHECGVKRNDLYDVFNWLVKRFDKQFKDMSFSDFHDCCPTMKIVWVNSPKVSYGDCCDYILDYESPN